MRMKRVPNYNAVADASDIIALVRGHDYDRFLAIQLAPRHKRAALYIVTAFYIEVARIREMVNEPIIGHMRLAWWREALDALVQGKPARNHPVILSLAPLLQANPVLADFLYTMIDARAVDFDDALLATEEDWYRYCAQTAGSLHRAWAMLLDADAARSCDAAITEQAIAYAMVGQLRAIPFMAQHGIVRFSRQRMAAYSVSGLLPSPALAAFVLAVCAEARKKLQNKNVNKCLRPLAFLGLLGAKYTLKLQNAGGDCYCFAQRNPGKLWKIACIKFL